MRVVLDLLPEEAVALVRVLDRATANSSEQRRVVAYVTGSTRAELARKHPAFYRNAGPQPTPTKETLL